MSVTTTTAPTAVATAYVEAAGILNAARAGNTETVTVPTPLLRLMHTVSRGLNSFAAIVPSIRQNANQSSPPPPPVQSPLSFTSVLHKMGAAMLRTVASFGQQVERLFRATVWTARNPLEALRGMMQVIIHCLELVKNKAWLCTDESRRAVRVFIRRRELLSGPPQSDAAQATNRRLLTIGGSAVATGTFMYAVGVVREAMLAFAGSIFHYWMEEHSELDGYAINYIAMQAGVEALVPPQFSLSFWLSLLSVLAYVNAESIRWLYGFAVGGSFRQAAVARLFLAYIRMIEERRGSIDPNTIPLPKKEWMHYCVHHIVGVQMNALGEPIVVSLTGPTTTTTSTPENSLDSLDIGLRDSMYYRDIVMDLIVENNMLKTLDEMELFGNKAYYTKPNGEIQPKVEGWSMVAAPHDYVAAHAYIKREWDTYHTNMLAAQTAHFQQGTPRKPTSIEHILQRMRADGDNINNPYADEPLSPFGGRHRKHKHHHQSKQKRDNDNDDDAESDEEKKCIVM